MPGWRPGDNEQLVNAHIMGVHLSWLQHLPDGKSGADTRFPFPLARSFNRLSEYRTAPRLGDERSRTTRTILLDAVKRK